MKKAASFLAALVFTAAMAQPAFAELDPETNLALGMTPIFVNERVGGEGVKAVDGNSSTSWSIIQVGDLSTVLDENGEFIDDIYFGVDFGMDVTFDKITIEFSVDRPSGDENGYSIQVSDDGETWSDAENAEYTYAEFTPVYEKVEDHTVDTVIFSEPVTSRYVRILIKRPCTNLKANQTIYEFSVFDTTGTANPEFEEMLENMSSQESEIPSVESTQGTSSGSGSVTTPSVPGTSDTSSAGDAGEADAGWVVPVIIVAAVVVVAVVVVVIVSAGKKKKS